MEMGFVKESKLRMVVLSGVYINQRGYWVGYI